MANLGFRVSDQTIGNILKRQGIPPAPEGRKTTTWSDFIRSHMDMLAAADWMTQMARNVTMADDGFLSSSRYLIHDRDSKFCESFQLTLDAVGIKTLELPARSPNLNSFAERWVRSAKTECLSKLILFGESSLRLALKQYVAHFHGERNHHGKGNLLLFPSSEQDRRAGSPIRCRQRLGELLRFYHREAA